MKAELYGGIVRKQAISLRSATYVCLSLSVFAITVTNYNPRFTWLLFLLEHFCHAGGEAGGGAGGVMWAKYASSARAETS